MCWFTSMGHPAATVNYALSYFPFRIPYKAYIFCYSFVHFSCSTIALLFDVLLFRWFDLAAAIFYHSFSISFAWLGPKSVKIVFGKHDFAALIGNIERKIGKKTSASYSIAANVMNSLALSFIESFPRHYPALRTTWDRHRNKTHRRQSAMKVKRIWCGKIRNASHTLSSLLGSCDAKYRQRTRRHSTRNSIELLRVWPN